MTKDIDVIPCSTAHDMYEQMLDTQTFCHVTEPTRKEDKLVDHISILINNKNTPTLQ